jgi:hypothetical protein
MKNFKQSDYALNKMNPKSIVFRFGDGSTQFFTREKLKDMSDKQFNKLKSDSDEIWHKIDLSDNYEGKHTAHCEKDEDVEVLTKHHAPSPEDIFIEGIERAEEETRRKKQIQLANAALATLTETQRRRYLLHIIDGFAVKDIVKIERRNYPDLYATLTHQSVTDSLKGAEKKIKKFLDKQ